MKLTASANSANTQTTTTAAPTHLSGRLLTLVRGTWIVLVTLILSVYVISLSWYFGLLNTVCQPALCVTDWQLTPNALHSLQIFGFSIHDYAVYILTLTIISSLVYFTVALVLFWRKSYDWMALLVGLFLMTLNTSSITTNVPLSQWLGHPLGTVLSSFLDWISTFPIFLMLALFPNGQFAPRWLRWVLAGAIVWAIIASFIPPVSAGWYDLLNTLLFFGPLVLLIGAQIYRYLRISTPTQRQQTKWVVFSLSLLILANILISVSETLLPSSANSLFQLGTNSLGQFLFILIPISLGIAILRYRLWDIDVLINKALVYGLLTGILAACYIGLVLGLESLIGRFSGQNAQPVVFVISTLAIAALFRPLRQRIQGIIDRRFYRRKYNAAQTLAAFSETLRNEVELNQLSEHLLDVVQQAIQPTHISLWLRKPAQKERE